MTDTKSQDPEHLNEIKRLLHRINQLDDWLIFEPFGFIFYDMAKEREQLIDELNQLTSGARQIELIEASWGEL